MTRRLVPGALLLLWAVLPAAALAADPSFGTPTARSTFLTGIAFEQPLTTGLAAGSTVEIVIDQNGSNTSFVALVPATAGGTKLHYELELPSGGAVPGTTFTARWRLTPQTGEPEVGPPISVVYEDDRFDWKTISGDVVRMHWYDGNAEFGRQALAIAERGIETAALFLGVDESRPLDFYVYADVAPFRDAIGPASRENVGGVAYAGQRIMLARFDPSMLGVDWVHTVIPHELTHVVFGEAVKNPYHSPPKWLNEGLAVYLSEGVSDSRRADLEAGIRSSSLIALEALVGQFPTSFERFLLGYAESVSAVDYLIRTYGQDKFVALIRSYAKGVSDDHAFQAALGVDVAGFEAGWLVDIGASAPHAYGPQPAPPGPLPPGWEAAPTPASSSVAASPTPAPTGEEPAPNGSNQGGLLVALGLAAVAILVGGLLLWRRRRGPRDPGGAA